MAVDQADCLALRIAENCSVEDAGDRNEGPTATSCGARGGQRRTQPLSSYRRTSGSTSSCITFTFRHREKPTSDATPMPLYTCCWPVRCCTR